MGKYLILSNTPKHGEDAYQITNKVLFQLLSHVKKIAYISSETDKNRRYFDKVKLFYNQMSGIKIDYFDYDLEYTYGQTEKLLNYDAIHLSTGNTYKFLAGIVDKNQLEGLRKVLKTSKLIIATSAGGHLLSKDIEYARFGDENKSILKTNEALNILNFYVVPHYEGKTHMKRAINELIKTRGDEVFFLDNGEGVLYDSDTGKRSLLKTK